MFFFIQQTSFGVKKTPKNTQGLFMNKRARHIILTRWTWIEIIRLRELELSFMKLL